MSKLQRKDNYYPAGQDNFVHEIIQRHLDNEPRRENNFLSNIFSKRVTNNFIRIKVYNNCTFYLGNGGEEDD